MKARSSESWGYYSHTVLWLVSIIYMYLIHDTANFFVSSFSASDSKHNNYTVVASMSTQNTIEQAGVLTESFHKGTVWHCRPGFTFTVRLIGDACSCACWHGGLKILLTCNCELYKDENRTSVLMPSDGVRFIYRDSTSIHHRSRIYLVDLHVIYMTVLALWSSGRGWTWTTGHYTFRPTARYVTVIVFNCFQIDLKCQFEICGFKWK